MTAVTFDSEQHRKQLSLSGVFGIQVGCLRAGALRPPPSTAFTTDTPQGAQFICLVSLLPLFLLMQMPFVFV